MKARKIRNDCLVSDPYVLQCVSEGKPKKWQCVLPFILLEVMFNQDFDDSLKIKDLNGQTVIS